MGVISENTAYRSVSVSVSVDKFSFVLGIESIGKKWYRYTFNIGIAILIMCSCYIMDNLAKVYIKSSQKHVIYGKQKYLGCKKVAWPRKTAPTKRTDIRV